MAEDIKGFIEKIQQEGVQAAKAKAQEIEQEARRRAEEILSEAKRKAEQINQETKERLLKMESDQKTLLQQAGRDFLLTLRAEINKVLHKLILAKVREALNPEALAGILSGIIKETVKVNNKAQIIVMLNPQDLKAVKQNFQDALSEEIKKGVLLEPQEGIQAGFLISYDAGKSQLDFSDKALAEFIGSSIKPQLEDLLKGAVSE